MSWKKMPFCSPTAMVCVPSGMIRRACEGIMFSPSGMFSRPVIEESVSPAADGTHSVGIDGENAVADWVSAVGASRTTASIPV